MGLTPAEQAELDALNSQLDAADGHQAVQKVDQQRFKPAQPGQTRDFSWYRVGIGGLRDAAQGLLDTVYQGGDWLQKHAPTPVVRLGSSADNGLIDVVSADTAAQQSKQLDAARPRFGKLEGEDNAGTAERITRGIVSFAAPFAAWSRVFGVVRGASWLGRAGAAMAAGAATDFTTTDPHGTNLANTLKETFGFDNEVINALSTEQDDDLLYQRFKAAAVNAPVGLVADAIFETGFKALRAYRDWRGSAEEAKAIVDAVRDVPVEPARPVHANDNASAGAANAAADEAAAGATGAAGKSTPDAMWTSTERPPENFEDILTFLKKRADVGNVDGELFNRLAQNLVEGNPENALAKLGIDPAKLDFSAFDDPDLLGRLHRGLADVYETIAGGLGRTGQRITEAATVSAAKTMATTADVLKDLYGNTSNLAETFMASRLFVGAHSSKLLSEAQDAVRAIGEGGGEQEWLKFLESFHRHAYFLGALRGAGSEVARALRQLQTIGKVGASLGKKAAAAGAKKTLDANAALSNFNPKELAQLAEDSVSKMVDPHERLALLGDVIQRQGDIGDVSRFVRTKSGSVLKRLDGAVGETRGNLFSSGTALMNVLSGTTMLGMNALAKITAATARMALSPFGRENAIKARVSMMDAWAYTDGLLGGWRDGIRNSITVLEREGMAELSLQADTYAAKDLARYAAQKSVNAAVKLGDNALAAERVDLGLQAERQFAINPSDRRLIDETIQSWNTPALMEHSLRWLTRALAAPVNAAGSLSRLGTILFINAPDQLVGTVAARAGAQAHAVRLAAQEAAELQLEGKALSEYLKARSVQLTKTVDGFADDAYSAGQREAALAHGHAEERAALFQDDPETTIGKALSWGLTQVPLLHIVIPFVKTPMRIVERTAIDYSPLGFLKDRIRADIAAGGARRDEALARIGLGTLAVMTAYQLAEDRTIVGNDGDYKSSARLSRPSYSLRVGDDVVEFNRLDPLGTLLGWGADAHAYLRDQDNKPDASGIIMQHFEAALVATQQNILSKMWLASLKNLTELADASSGDEFNTRLGKYLQTFAARVVPASGIQRSVQKGIDGVNRDASTFQEALLKASIGADRLPEKRDPLLGRPVTLEGGDRLLGIKAGPGGSAVDDPLVAELDNLSFDVPAAKRTISGVKLTSPQFSRWLELRGQVVKNPDTGLTLEQSLSELIKLPEYVALPRAGRIEAVRKEMDGFSKLATQQLTAEDKSFAYKVLQKEVWAEGILSGKSSGQMDRETEDFGRKLGLVQ